MCDGGLSERTNGEGRTCGQRKQLEMKTYPPKKGIQETRVEGRVKGNSIGGRMIDREEV